MPFRFVDVQDLSDETVKTRIHGTQTIRYILMDRAFPDTKGTCGLSDRCLMRDDVFRFFIYAGFKPIQNNTPIYLMLQYMGRLL